MKWHVFFRTGALGDFIVSLPLLQQLPRPICLISHRRHYDLLKMDIDAFIDCNSSETSRLFEPGNGPWGGQLHEKILPGARFYAFQKEDRVLEERLTRRGCSEVVWLDPRPTSPPHIARQFFDAAGLQTPTDLAVKVLWPRHGKGDSLWIHPGSGSVGKNAIPSLFAEVARIWGGPIVLSFGEADHGIRDAVLLEFRDRGIDARIVEGVSILELREQLRLRAAYYIGNDSGVSHLAAACGIRSGVVFKASDPKIWLPLGPSKAFKESPVDEILGWLAENKADHNS